MQLMGVDGCPTGWVAAISDEHLQAPEFAVFEHFAALLARCKDGPVMVGVDIPIGLSDSTPRECDIAARSYLGWPRRSSVFPAPSRAALEARTFEEACRLNARALGKRLSIQGWNILAKIREVDEMMTPERGRWIHEVHPEVTFAVLSGRNHGLDWSKKAHEGENERLALLPGSLGRLDPAAITAALRPARVHRDDVVDALACLVTVGRIFQGRVLRLPQGPTVMDERGIRMEIVA